MVVVQTDRDANSSEKQEFRVFSFRPRRGTVIVKAFIELWDYISTGNSPWKIKNSRRYIVVHNISIKNKLT